MLLHFKVSIQSFEVGIFAFKCNNYRLEGPIEYKQLYFSIIWINILLIVTTCRIVQRPRQLRKLPQISFFVSSSSQKTLTRLWQTHHLLVIFFNAWLRKYNQIGLKILGLETESGSKQILVQIPTGCKSRLQSDKLYNTVCCVLSIGDNRQKSMQ